MNRKERVYAVLQGEAADRVPTGFWMHFPAGAFYGESAVRTHLEYFAQSRTDLCKVMTEYIYPCDHSILNAGDWRQVPAYTAGAPFIEQQAQIIRAIAGQCPDAPVVATLHGVVASASHALLGVPGYDTVGRHAQLYHLRTDPEPVLHAYRNIAATLREMARAFVRAGAEGIYYAALGGERDGFSDEEHAQYIAPLDKQILEAAYDAGARFVILHMCKPRVALKRFTDYPCDIVNWGIRESGVSLWDGARMFPGKVPLGGLDNRHSALIEGDDDRLEEEILDILSHLQGRPFFLGSDCTLPGSLPYRRIAAVARICERYAAGGKKEMMYEQ